MKYKFQTASVRKAQRPEYENGKNEQAWATREESDDPVYLLHVIANLLNDEEQFNTKWVRIKEEE